MNISYFFIHSPIDRHVGCLYFLSTKNNVAINIHVQVVVRTFIWEYICRSAIAGNSMFNSLTVFQSGCTILHSHQQCKRVLGNFPGGTVVKNPPANAGDTGSSPGLGRSHMLRSN